MITTVRTQWAYLQDLYRMNFPHAGNTASPFDVQDILAGMGISREAFGKLVEAGFVRGDDTIRILFQKRSAESVQNDLESVSGMTRGELDRAHWLWRLAKGLGWGAGSLERVLALAGATVTEGALTATIAIV